MKIDILKSSFPPQYYVHVKVEEEEVENFFTDFEEDHYVEHLQSYRDFLEQQRLFQKISHSRHFYSWPTESLEEANALALKLAKHFRDSGVEVTEEESLS